MPWNWPSRASTSSLGQASPARARPKGWRGAPPVIREIRPTSRSPRDRKPRMGGSHDGKKDPSREREGTADPARLAGGQGRTRSPGGPLRRRQPNDQAGPYIAGYLHPAGAVFNCPAAAPLVVVDYLDTLTRPAERGGVIGEGVLTLPGFLMVKNLLRAGLANVDDGEFTSMPIGDGRRAAAKNGGAKTRRGPFTERTAHDCGGVHASPPEEPALW